ncbi:uncharacterized protein A4U43_UnF7730 [Asparagus officinalis]|uniref:Serine-threonine/tyrosine-protein kinase catalytic domain-containing protein n=1 Tax=Asparagus officinalis TaxID=4686 RepID=A0A1R3L635_ASPOF|nr:uncharacterized protein A4U43_UnF7730 [Asparagus officinalis]
MPHVVEKDYVDELVEELVQVADKLLVDDGANIEEDPLGIDKDDGTVVEDGEDVVAAMVEGKEENAEPDFVGWLFLVYLLLLASSGCVRFGHCLGTGWFDSAKRGVHAVHEGIVERVYEVVRYISAKSMLIVTICLALCMRVMAGTRVLLLACTEYFMHGIVNEKTDVFAYGVLLLELITGRRVVDSSIQSLVIWNLQVFHRVGMDAFKFIVPTWGAIRQKKFLVQFIKTPFTKVPAQSVSVFNVNLAMSLVAVFLEVIYTPKVQHDKDHQQANDNNETNIRGFNNGGLREAEVACTVNLLAIKTLPPKQNRREKGHVDSVTSRSKERRREQRLRCQSPLPLGDFIAASRVC